MRKVKKSNDREIGIDRIYVNQNTINIFKNIKNIAIMITVLIIMIMCKAEMNNLYATVFLDLSPLSWVTTIGIIIILKEKPEINVYYTLEKLFFCIPESAREEIKIRKKGCRKVNKTESIIEIVWLAIDEITNSVYIVIIGISGTLSIGFSILRIVRGVSFF